MGLNCLKARVTLRRQFTFYHKFKVYLKYTSLLNSWCTQSILEHTNLNYYSITFIKLQTLEVKISTKVYLKYAWQAFTNQNFSYTRFCARKTVLRASPCTWEFVHIREQMYTLLIIRWFGGRNCTKLVFKPLAAKKGLSVSVLCTGSFL